MDIKHGLIDSIGNTPLIRLKKASEETGCDIYGKAEFMNPGQSVKDRAALFIIQDALAKGTLQPGGVIVEPQGTPESASHLSAMLLVFALSSLFQRPSLRKRKTCCACVALN
jgi:hypothetical protein